jgi:hypothetical protein
MKRNGEGTRASSVVAALPVCTSLWIVVAPRAHEIRSRDLVGPHTRFAAVLSSGS